VMDYNTIINDDCLHAMQWLEDNSIDSIVTDPPYGLSFIGKDWDHGVPGEAFWREALRVAKPGAHLLAFGGTRTHHRLMCAIEDAGWEIRDCLGWLYGSGFPKSLDVSKAIDKVNGEGNRLHKFTAWMRTTGLTARQLDDVTGTNMGGHYLTAASQPAIPTAELWGKLRPLCGDIPPWVDELVRRVEAEREVVGHKTAGMGSGNTFGMLQSEGDNANADKVVPITAPATPEAVRWNGWGTALKPAWEPIVLARKPLIGTVAQNVLEHGTGALNIDGCRVGTLENSNGGGYSKNFKGSSFLAYGGKREYQQPSGRFPANLIHDGSDEVEAVFPKNASRFFYCAKASSSERGEGNNHPTVKPLALMRYLCRLVTPPDGVVLDPFCGSGSTLVGALQEGFRYLGIEKDPDYVNIAYHRTKGALKEMGKEAKQLALQEVAS